jgi:pilus assembly protein Flp/PilA
MVVVNPFEPGPRSKGLLWWCRNLAGTPIMEGKMLSTYVTIAMAKLSLLRGDKNGVTAIEYGLIAGAIAVVIIGAVQLLGTNVSLAFTAIANALIPPAPP